MPIMGAPHLSLLLVSLFLYRSDAFLGPLVGSSPQSTSPTTTTTRKYVHATIIAPFATQPPFDMSEYRGDIISSSIGSVRISLESQQEKLTRTTPPTSDDKVEDNDEDCLEKLCQLLGGTPTDLLRFQSTSEDGVRGVYLKNDVKKDQVILRLPLSSCLQDSSPPSWMTWKEGDEDDNDGYHSSDWATRLAASLLDLQLTTSGKEEGQTLWLSLLPDAEHLRASLPVHWPEETVEGARSTSLELAVDSAYFGRAEAVEDLLSALRSNSGLVDDFDDMRIRRLCHNALDIIQTRSCRLNSMIHSDDDGDESPPLRVLAPVFDFINHGSIKVRGDTGANAQFQREGDYLVVRAVKDVNANEEVLIDYGESARPAWRCLLSYGFVPQYTPIPGPHEDATVDSEDEDNEAEVFMDGTRYIVGPSQIPCDMVTSAFESDHPTPNEVVDDDDEDDDVVSLTPEVALKLAKRISDVAFYLLLEQEQQDMYDDDPAKSATPFDIISNREAAALRWSQHRVLLACALGLQEYAAENS